MKALILDDEAVSVEIMLAQVNWKSCGIDEVFTAYNAEEAREVLKQSPVDVILCDIEMPGENGIEFMQWARKNGYTMTCIFLTCHAKFEYAQEALRLGSMDYILLPAPFDVIEQRVREAVDGLKEKQIDAKVKEMGKRYIQTQKEFIRQQYGEVKSKESFVAQADLYIHEHLGDFDLSVPKIAEYLNLSPDYLNSIFKQEKGITLNKYIIQTRMEVAELLIREGNISISAIAEQLGYENYSYFSSSFKKAYGCSPTSYGKIPEI